MSTATKAGRLLRRYFAGGIWFVEVTWSWAGMPRPDGTSVKYSGWHPHLHGLLELTEPPEEMVTALGLDAARAKWRVLATQALLKHWNALDTSSRRSAQRVERVDAQRVGQVCKYPLKPFGFENPARAREAALALAERRMHDAWGTWRGWRKIADQLLAADELAKREAEAASDGDKPEASKIVLSQQPLLCIARWNRVPDGKKWGVIFGSDNAESRASAPVAQVIAAIRREPCTFASRDARAAKEALKRYGPTPMSSRADHRSS